jgi:hypothetical protein
MRLQPLPQLVPGVLLIHWLSQNALSYKVGDQLLSCILIVRVVLEQSTATLITFTVNLGDVLGGGGLESVLYLQGDLLYTVKYGMG